MGFPDNILIKMLLEDQILKTRGNNVLVASYIDHANIID